MGGGSDQMCIWWLEMFPESSISFPPSFSKGHLDISIIQCFKMNHCILIKKKMNHCIWERAVLGCDYLVSCDVAQTQSWLLFSRV